MRCMALMLIAGLSVPAVAAQWTQGHRQQVTPPPARRRRKSVPAGRRGRDVRPPTDAAGRLRADEVQQIVDGWEIATAEKMPRADRSAVRPVHPAVEKAAERTPSAVHAASADADEPASDAQPAAGRPTTPRSTTRSSSSTIWSEDISRNCRALHAAIDAVLTPRQRARFRVLQEQMERRKLEVLSRAMRAGGSGK